MNKDNMLEERLSEALRPVTLDPAVRPQIIALVELCTQMNDPGRLGVLLDVAVLFSQTDAGKG